MNKWILNRREVGWQQIAANHPSLQSQWTMFTAVSWVTSRWVNVITFFWTHPVRFLHGAPSRCMVEHRAFIFLDLHPHSAITPAPSFAAGSSSFHQGEVTLAGVNGEGEEGWRGLGRGGEERGFLGCCWRRAAVVCRQNTHEQLRLQHIVLSLPPSLGVCACVRVHVRACCEP